MATTRRQTDRQTDIYFPSLCTAISLLVQLHLLGHYYYYYYYYYYYSFHGDLVIKTTGTERECFEKQCTVIMNILFTRYSAFIARYLT